MGKQSHLVVSALHSPSSKGDSSRPPVTATMWPTGCSSLPGLLGAPGQTSGQRMRTGHYISFFLSLPLLLKPIIKFLSLHNFFLDSSPTASSLAEGYVVCEHRGLDWCHLQLTQCWLDNCRCSSYVKCCGVSREVVNLHELLTAVEACCKVAARGGWAYVIWFALPSFLPLFSQHSPFPELPWPSKEALAPIEQGFSLRISLTYCERGWGLQRITASWGALFLSFQ